MRAASAEWMGLHETADKLSVSVRTVQNMARRGQLERRRAGRHSLYRVPAPTTSATGALVASVAPVASIDELGSRLDDLEFEVEQKTGDIERQLAEQTTELERRIDELTFELEEQRLANERLEEEVERLEGDLVDLAERLDALEALQE